MRARAGRGSTPSDNLGSVALAPLFLDSQHWFQVADGKLRETRDAGLTWTAVADTGAVASRVSQPLTFESLTGPRSPFTTSDGIHAMLSAQAWPGTPSWQTPFWSYWSDGCLLTNVPVLFLSDDGGRTWQLADFTAR